MKRMQSLSSHTGILSNATPFAHAKSTSVLISKQIVSQSPANKENTKSTTTMRKIQPSMGITAFSLKSKRYIQDFEDNSRRIQLSITPPNAQEK